MRRAYKRMLHGCKERGPSPFRLLAHVLSAHIRPGLVPPPAPPLFATLEVTHDCNLHCAYCESRQVAASPPPSYWYSALDEIVEMKIPAVGITGGEPLLFEEIEGLAARAAAAGLWVHLNTNGTLVDGKRARALVKAGIASVNLSLESADPSLHDRVRGHEAFERTLQGVRHLVQARAASGSDRPRILLAVTLGGHNADGVEEILCLGEALGVEGCTFLPLVFFRNGKPRIPVPSAARAAAFLSGLAGDPRVDNSRAYLRGMERFFSGSPMPLACSALHTSIVVSCDGRLYPCVPSALRRRGGVPRKPGTLGALFRSGALRSGLDETLCRGCWWNCHRELDLALGILP